MNTNIKQIVIYTLVIAAFLGGMGYIIVKTSAPSGPSKLDGFAQCLKDKGATFYGAFWCPHCQNQKKEFGSAAKLLPYVECSTLDGKGQTDICKEKKIEGYPTWEFADGSRESGEVALEKLAEKTGCVLPESVAKTDTPAEPQASPVASPATE